LLKVAVAVAIMQLVAVVVPEVEVATLLVLAVHLLRHQVELNQQVQLLMEMPVVVAVQYRKAGVVEAVLLQWVAAQLAQTEPTVEVDLQRLFPELQ
jgi:hypothetical protein